MKNASVGIITHKAPFGHMSGKEAQDVALIFGSYEQDISVYFIGDGVYHFNANQHPESIHAKDYLKTYDAFSFYDIENVYVCQASLDERGISQLPSFVTLMTHDELKNKLQQHQTIFTF